MTTTLPHHSPTAKNPYFGANMRVLSVGEGRATSLMDNTPLVSVVMPCYNGSKTIANAIMSIKTQSYKNWELIIVEDGSDDRDETERIIMRFEDDRIKYIPIKHSGVVEAQMTGHRVANGEIQTVQAADDFSMPDRIEKAVNYFIKHKVDVYVHSLYINMWDDYYNCMIRTYREQLPQLHNSLLEEQTINGVPFFRKEVIDTCPLREETRDAYDWMMHLDWAYSGFSYGYEDKALYEYVRYTGSLSERNEKSGKRAKALEKIKTIMKEEYNQKFNPKG